MRPFFMVLGGCALAMGCAQVLGLEDWKDPPGSGGATSSSTGTGGASTSSSKSASHSTSSGGLVDAGATCADGVHNGLETDVDCGGDTCAPCGLARQCKSDADCASAYCLDKRCAVRDGGSPCENPDAAGPTCHDCVRDGLETDVDCGGDACLPCGGGKGCLSDVDCTSESCVAKKCATGSPGKPCHVGADCSSQMCGAGSCWTGACCQ